MVGVRFVVSAPCWNHYPQAALQELMADHPLLFPGFEPSDEPVRPSYAPWRRAGVRYVDSWGCAWEPPEDGLAGAVVEQQ